MPIPNHCFECSKPINASDGWYCEQCKPDEEE
jgi:predicted nucleic acid-binding Zn ribbon protein